MRYFNIILFIINIPVLQAQPFDPPAGQEGSLAIPYDSPLFIDWASKCELKRGYGIICYPDSVRVDYGTPEHATGMAGDGKVVSLGDSGEAILTFNTPISDAPGPDFAVFENAFTESFLELAFVEVSSDGVSYFRFPAVSLTPSEPQVSAFGQLEARLLYNLAGKYILNFGTPFDLEELSGQAGLDVHAVTHVKIIDVIGSVIDSLASFDSEGHVINDPWPTPFNNGGFDLDAIGVIHNQLATGEIPVSPDPEIELFPNPATDWINIIGRGLESGIISIINTNGLQMYETNISSTSMKVNISSWSPGPYIIQIMDETKIVSTELIIKH